MQAFRARRLRRRHDRLGVEIAWRLDGLIGKPGEARAAVDRRMQRNGFHAHPARRRDDPAGDRRGGDGGGRGMPASRLRLPQRERRLRRSLRARGRRLRRAAARGDARDGPEERRQGADGEGRRARRARLSRRQPDAEVPEGEGLRDRLSRADQGDRRRRRARHAPGRRACRFRRRRSNRRRARREPRSAIRAC